MAEYTTLPLPAHHHGIDPREITVPKALDFVQGINSCSYTTLVDCDLITATDNIFFRPGDVIVTFDMCPQVGQRPVNDIRYTERIAVHFDAGDQIISWVYALRGDFPKVLHRNALYFEEPSCLCIYENTYEEHDSTADTAFQNFGIDTDGAKLTIVPLNMPDNSQLNLLQFETSGNDVNEIFDIGDTRKIMGVNLAVSEWTAIIQQANQSFVAQYPIYLMISNKQLLKDTDGITYTTLAIDLVGYVLDGDNINVNQISTNINLNTYGNF